MKTAEREISVTKRLLTATILAGGAGLAGIAIAAETDGATRKSGPDINFEIAAGVDYDSNISVNELDANTGEDDFAAAIEADFDLTTPVGPNTEFQLGYGFSQSLHADFTAFDLQSHLATADLSHDFGPLEVGAAYRFAYSRLGGASFFTMHQVNPYAAAFIGKQFYVRGGYTWSDKDFDTDPLRDAKNRSYGADAYFFLNGVKSYIVGGYERERENTVGDEFDYRSDNFRVRFAQRFPFGADDAELSVGFRREARDYDNVTASIGEVRNDKRNRFQAQLELPITDFAFARLEYEHGDYNSNLPAADYKEDLAGVRLGLRF